MPDIRVSQPHGLEVPVARERLSSFEDLLAKYRVRLDWDGPRARVAGVPGVGGEVVVREGEVAVHVSISRMVTMMGLDPAKLEKTIRRRLAEAFA